MLGAGWRVRMFVINDMRFDSRVRREATTLAAAGYDVVVYAVMSDATTHLEREDDPRGFRIVRLPMLMRPQTVVGTDATSAARPTGALRRRALVAVTVATRPLFGGTLHFLANWHLRWRPWSRRALAKIEPGDIWHAHDLNALPLAIECADRYGGAVIYDSHEIFVDAGATSALPAPARAILQRLERGWARRADAVITVNDSIADVLRERLDVDQLHVVHNCADAPDSAESPLRDSIGVDSAVRVALYHGSITTGRGLETLVASMTDPRLRDVHLALMGYGPIRPHLQKLAASSPAAERIHFLPLVPPSDVTRWVSGADVAVMPIEPSTLNHRLSSPNKLFEAIAAGVPVVGPSFAEFQRIVVDGPNGPLGVLHDGHSPTDVAVAIDGVLSLPRQEYAAMRARCRTATVERWSWGVESQRLLTMYAALSPATSPATVNLPAMVQAAEPD